MPPPAHTRRRLRRVAAGVCAFGVLAGGSAVAASAADEGPSQAVLDRARADVAAASSEVAALDARYAAAAAALLSLRQEASALGEAAHGARYELQRATTAAREARAAARAAQVAARGAHDALRSYAAAAYEQGGTLGSLGPLLEAGDPQQLLDRASVLEVLGDHQGARLSDAVRVSGTATSLERAADAAEAARAQAAERAARAQARARVELARASTEAQRLSATRAHLAQRLASLRDTSARLERERLDAIAQAAQEAEQDAAQPDRPSGGDTPAPTATTTRPSSPSSTTPRPSTTTTSRPPTTTTTSRPPTTTTTSRPPSTTSTSTPPPPPPPAGAAAAIAYAQAQLGKPYLWGGDGPESFDCSGLTMMAWRQAGVYLSHYTGAQWAETARVPIDQLAPGDLVFYGSSGSSSHHMGLYVGGGQMIEAPYTGAVVRYASIYRSDLIPYGGRPG